MMKKDLKEVAVAYSRDAALYSLMNRVYFLGRDKRYRSMIADRVVREPEDAVLDLCCGTGLDFPFIAQRTDGKGRMIGVDVSSGMLQQANKKIGREASFVRADAAHLPFIEGTFDAILVSFCLKTTPTYKTAIEEASRLLKPSGRIGVLANADSSGPSRLLRPVIIKVLSAMFKIDFQIDLKSSLSERFAITEDRIVHGGLVEFLVGESAK